MIAIFGSLLQGGLDGHPIFCIVMAVLLVRVSANQNMASQWKNVRVWMYVDDVLLQCAVSTVRALMAAVHDEAGRLRLRLQVRKCHMHIPALAAVPLEDFPTDIRSLQDILPIAVEGITILGTEEAGDRALPMGPWPEAAVETRARAARACVLADAAMQLVMRPPPA